MIQIKNRKDKILYTSDELDIRDAILDAIFNEANLESVNLWKKDISGINLTGMNLKGGYFDDAIMKEARLIKANLRKATFNFANLNKANLKGAILRDAELRHADLSDIVLEGADLRGANLSYANLSDANLYEANLRDADLRNANLTGAYIRRADLRNADLRNAILDDVHFDALTAGYTMACPSEGSFIGWKTAEGYIVKLLIPEDAKRCSATLRECRCSKAIVLDIQHKDGTPMTEEKFIRSNRKQTFIYEVGKTVVAEDFEEDRWNDCAPGIHFFIDRKDAVNYMLECPIIL